MQKKYLSVKKFYGKRSGDDVSIKDGFLDWIDNDIESLKRRHISNDFEVEYGSTFAVKNI